MKDYVRATREPFHNVHFCGTESATRWQGYIDGAAESGIRAANEVLFKMNHEKCDYEKTYYFQCEQQTVEKKITSDSFSFFDFGLGFVLSMGLLLMILFYAYVFISIEMKSW